MEIGAKLSSIGIGAVAATMTLDTDALQSAQQALDDRLRAEAEQQHAYFAELPDGRISLELEWLDSRSIAREIVAAYLARVAQTKISGRD